MKILWLKSDFLHPVNRGGQIRSLEMLRRLHRRHEVHYVAFGDPSQPEGLARAGEYSCRAWPVPHTRPRKGSVEFYARLAANLISPLPAVIANYRSAAMRRQVEDLLTREKFDSFVCDFLTPAINVPRLGGCVLFQHNVETMIWRRYVETAADPLRRTYFRLQAGRMFRYERDVCRAVGQVVAVSEADAQSMQQSYGVKNVVSVPTGVDIDYFLPGSNHSHVADLVFVGSMDWMPNIDAVDDFVKNILPRIRAQQPECSLAVVGRNPPPSVHKFAERDPLIQVTGTVADVRPYLWGSSVSIVPLRVGGGTRLKIYEAMAAKIPVVSTSIGAEGLEIDPPSNIRIADAAEGFAAECLSLLASREARVQVAAAAWEMVSSRCSWEAVTAAFERILETGPRPG
jgi:sugar transferase (PEP-CTERM/EpsH1 system associated)